MSISGLTLNPPKLSCCVVRGRGASTLRSPVSPSICNGISRKKTIFLSHTEKKYLTSSVHIDSIRRHGKMKSIAYAVFGDMPDDSNDVFPRINVKDPYKRLGISEEASEEETQAARNYLIHRYGGHQPSLDAIESAHNKIIMRSFYDRKNPKINFEMEVRKVSQSRVVKAVTSMFETPATSVIIKTAIVFIILGVLTVLFPTEEGPTLQVAISLIAAIYFIHSRLKSRLRAFLYGIAALFGSWLLGTFLMVSVVPPLLKGPRSLEVTTSLISYVLLWIASTYLK